MELSANHPNVYVIEGNCDTLVEDLLNENPKLNNYLRTRKRSLLNEWLKELGYYVNYETNVKDTKKRLIHHFSEEMKWLSDLPTAIETEDYIFVHAGLEEIENWRDTDRATALTMPSFLEKSHHADKFAIVGHWSVVNYSSHVPSHNPIIDREKKIIAIDGGNVIKPTGQLNAFIIDRSPSEDRFSYTYVDHLPNANVSEEYHAELEMFGSIAYPFYDVVPVKKGEHFSLCKQQETNKLLHVKNEYLKQQNQPGLLTVKSDLSCALLSVKKGELVSIIDDSCSGYDLIKKTGKSAGYEKAYLLIQTKFAK